MATIHATTVYREDGGTFDYELAVLYTVTPGAHDTRDDPGYPAEIEIVSATLERAEFELTDDEIARILEDHEWDTGPDPDDARDRMIDDRLTGAAS